MAKAKKRARFQFGSAFKSKMKNPLPQYEPALGPIDYDRVTVEVLQIKDLKSKQSFISQMHLKGFTENYDHLDGCPLIVRTLKGDLVIKDGNHRVVSALLRGIKEIRCRVVAARA